MKPLKPFPRSNNPGAPLYVRFEVKGKPYLWSTKTTDKKLAKIRGEQYRAEIIAERYHLADGMKARSGAATFDQLIADYKTFPEPAERTRKANCSALLAILKVSGHSGKETLDRISASLAVAWQKHGRAQKLPVASINSTLRRARSLFSKRAMLLYGHDTKPNADRVRDLFSVPALKEPETRPELPSADAIAKAISGLQDRPEYYRAYLLARYGGLRSGEAAAARKNWLEVQRNETGKVTGGILYIGGREFTAKSRKWRPVAMPSQVVEILLASPTDSLVGEYPYEVLRNLPIALRGYGFPANKPYHSLRRLFGSIVYTEQGPRQARDSLGHSTQQVTDRAYARSLDLPQPIPYAG